MRVTLLVVLAFTLFSSSCSDLVKDQSKQNATSKQESQPCTARYVPVGNNPEIALDTQTGTLCRTITDTNDLPSPIVIPLHGGDYSDAFSNYDADEVVKYDFAGKGNLLWMSWIKKGAPYGFLILFRDKAGLPDPNWQTDGNTIDSSRKMFGNLTKQAPYDPTTMPTGKDALHHPNGFLALRFFDLCDPVFRAGGKCLGVLNKEAAIWPQLRVWVDTDMTGDSRFGKIYSLDELDITEINLKYVEENRKDRYGNKLSFKGSMIQNDKPVVIYDVFFRARAVNY